VKLKKNVYVCTKTFHTKRVSCNNRYLIKDIGNYFVKVKVKWERHVCKSSSSSSSSSSSRKQVTGLDVSSFT
jgi:hypothetical protein